MTNFIEIESLPISSQTELMEAKNEFFPDWNIWKVSIRTNGVIEIIVKDGNRIDHFDLYDCSKELFQNIVAVDYCSFCDELKTIYHMIDTRFSFKAFCLECFDKNYL